MKWSKRLKWIRISKIVIPIALAISIIFAGFSVFANEAKNFVVDVSFDENIKLSLTYNEDLTDLTDHLDVPVLGKYRDVTWAPGAGRGLKYADLATNPPEKPNIPDDIALQEGVHTVFADKDVVAFFSFSFYLVNNSNIPVTIDMSINIDEVVTGDNKDNHHIDDAIRLMVIQGKHLLSDRASTAVYKKAEINADEEAVLKELTKDYSESYPVINFASNTCVMSNSELTLNPGSVTDRSNVERFTIVLWLEGWDRECTEAIYPESMKMSMSFKGVE